MLFLRARRFAFFIFQNESLVSNQMQQKSTTFAEFVATVSNHVRLPCMCLILFLTIISCHSKIFSYKKSSSELVHEIVKLKFATFHKQFLKMILGLCFRVRTCLPSCYSCNRSFDFSFQSLVIDYLQTQKLCR